MAEIRARSRIAHGNLHTSSPATEFRLSLGHQTRANQAPAVAQGIITIEYVVEPNGECGDVRIVRACAPRYGLDRQALDAARRWLFRPGTRGGEPVPVLVSLEIEFNIR